MKIIKEFRNNLLKRNEVDLVFEAESNPGFSGAREVVVKKFKANEDGIVVKAVRSEFGKNEFLVEAFIYDSKKDMEKIEPKSKKSPPTHPQEKSKPEETHPQEPTQPEEKVKEKPKNPPVPKVEENK